MEAAIFEDCINLVEKFTEHGNTSFESFCEQWKLMMFQHMYSAQTSAVEIIQTTKTMLHLAKRIVCAKDDVGKIVAQVPDNKQQILRRIGGMYLIYAVYFKQPTGEYAKVLVSPETWREILTFIEGLPTEQETDEVRYVFWRLYQSDAFRFTALDFDVGLEDVVDYDKIYDSRQETQKDEVVRVKLKLKLQTISETEKVLPEMTELEDKYNNIKESIVGTKKSTMNTLPPTKIFHDIQDVIKNIHGILNEKTREYVNNKPRGNYSETRKSLKRKAAGIADLNIEKYNDDESTVEDPSLQDVVKKAPKRMALKNMMSQSLPDHIVDDLKNSSSEDDEEDEEITMEAESEEEHQENSD